METLNAYSPKELCVTGEQMSRVVERNTGLGKVLLRLQQACMLMGMSR